VELSAFKGKPVVLVFYPADWSPVCGDQVALYNEMLDEFANSNAQLLGISVDGVMVPSRLREGPQPTLSAPLRFRAKRESVEEVRCVPL